MKAFTYLTTIILALNTYSFDFRNHSQSIRTNENLIIEISDVSIISCPECHTQLDRYSYQVEIKDAYLGIKSESTARGVIYHPYTSSYITKESGVSIWESPLEVPEEGLYIGKITKHCPGLNMMANGECRAYEIKYHIQYSLKN